jgi:hypothetical protein
MVLVIQLSVFEDWVTGEFDPKLWPAPPNLNVELGMAADQHGEESAISSFPRDRYLLEVCDLELGASTKEGFSVFASPYRIPRYGNDEHSRPPQVPTRVRVCQMLEQPRASVQQSLAIQL